MECIVIKGTVVKEDGPFLTLASGPIKVHQLIHGHFRIHVLDKLRTAVQTIDSMERKTCEVHYDGRVERKTRTTDVEEEDKDLSLIHI